MFRAIFQEYSSFIFRNLCNFFDFLFQKKFDYRMDDLLDMFYLFSKNFRKV